MLELNNTFLLVIDIQGKLAHLMHEKEKLFANAKRMIEGAKTLGFPIIWTEQIPDKLGPTVPEVAEVLIGIDPIKKSSFSCCGDGGFIQTLERLPRRQALLIGIETHICVYQTASDLLKKNYEVHIVADAVSSRMPENKDIALRKMERLGAQLTCAEMALYEIMITADHARFRDILKIVK